MLMTEMEKKKSPLIKLYEGAMHCTQVYTQFTESK